MANIAIVTDSTADLSAAFCDEQDIHVVPLKVIFGQESFREGMDVEAAQFYTKMSQENALPTTSQPSVGEFTEVYEQLAANYDEIISIHISAELSGTVNAATNAASIVEGVNVHVVDSALTSQPLVYLIEFAVRLRNEGKPVDEIVKRLEQAKSTIQTYFVVDDLQQLHRGGRLNAAQYVMGSMLKIKPVLTLTEGKIVPFEKVRTKKKALGRIETLLTEYVADRTPLRIDILHANVPEEAAQFQSRIQEAYPNVAVGVGVISPVVGAHVGQGTMGMTWYTEAEEWE